MLRVAFKSHSLEYQHSSQSIYIELLFVKESFFPYFSPRAVHLGTWIALIWSFKANCYLSQFYCSSSYLNFNVIRFKNEVDLEMANYFFDCKVVEGISSVVSVWDHKEQCRDTHCCNSKSLAFILLSLLTLECMTI